MTTPIDVAVGVLIRDDGTFLLAQRPPGKPMAGWWEFPGGKVEAGESVFDALVREFDEELGLRILRATPWVQRVFVYPHATVRLHFWRSFGDRRGWTGEPDAREGQAFCWERLDRISTEPWLAGAVPVRRWLQLPAQYAISNASAVGVHSFLVALDGRLADNSFQSLLLREPGMDPRVFDGLFDAVQSRCAASGVRLLVSSRHPPAYGSKAGGIHLTSQDLMQLERRPEVDRCFASCHDASQLERVAALDLDAAVVGPVSATTSHPDAPTLGWSGFARLAATAGLPVYALGGLTRQDLPTAREAGAHGVAMIRGAWP